MRRLLLIPLTILLASCAIPVRPIAVIVKDSETQSHYERDEKREPHLDVSAWAPLLGLLGGPWGKALELVVTGLASGAVVHKCHKRKNKKAAAASKLPA